MPPRLTANDFDPDLLVLFDAYVHGRMDRRGFLSKAEKFAKAGMTAAGLLAALSPDFAAGQQVRKDDPRLRIEWVDVPSPLGNGTIKGYLVRPAAAGSMKLPAVLVIHENRGLNPHIEDIARRLALDGFMAFAPDALTPVGGYPGDEDKARTAFGTIDQPKTLQDFLAAAAWLKARADGTGKYGAVGFCWGGGMTHKLAVLLPDLNAAVPFYGPAPAPGDAVKVKAPLLVQLAGTDDFVNPSWEKYEPALKAAGAKYAVYQYAGTQHGFNNDTTPRYDASAAKLAWERTIAFFKTNLAAAPARTARVRGTIVSSTASSIVVRTRTGDMVPLALAPDVVVTEVYPVDFSEVRAGAFIGSGAMPQADGTQRAIAVFVFPEARRGSGEGHYPFDYAPESTMTNATVAEVVGASDGSRIRVRYKDGDKTIVVLPGTPIASFKAGDRGLIVNGASVSLTATEIDGVATATRINAGRGGYVVPY